MIVTRMNQFVRSKNNSNTKNQLWITHFLLYFLIQKLILTIFITWPANSIKTTSTQPTSTSDKKKKVPTMNKKTKISNKQRSNKKRNLKIRHLLPRNLRRR